ncbi:MAG: GNAT family N-acetyltransferase [Rhodospirillales bacterium]|nr:GNAT family N-acetyltransferase [Rhodospirillales bacterium]
MTPSIEVTGTPDPALVAAVTAGLVAANHAGVGPSDRRALGVFARGEALLGGLVGYTAWGWLYVERLWVADAARGRGLAALLLDAAESEARSRGCRAAWIDTFSSVARRVYERAGFEVFGTLPDFPPGHTRWFLRKAL